MSRSRRVPKYRHYKPKGLGVVRINGRDHYLGKHDSPESWEKYHRLIADHLAAQGRPLAQVPISNGETTGLTINQMLLAYWKHAESYYIRDGKFTKELGGMRDAIRPLRRLYASTPAAEFGPLKLKALRNYMIDEQDLCRKEINKRIGRVKRVFRWAVSEELIPPSVIHGLDAVKGLRKGLTRARESKKVKPVPAEHVNALLPYLPPQLVAMIEVQRHTGMRPGEVVILRVCDIDMTSQPGVWVFMPDRHKKDWRDEVRAVAIGPCAQRIIEPFLDRPADAYLFSPDEAYSWRLENRPIRVASERKTPIYPSELRAREKAKRLRRQRKSKRPKRERYTTESYWKALDYAFRRLAKKGVALPRWFPYQLRHSRGTELRKKYGVEASRVTLGHSRLDATEIYAEKDLMQAIEIAREAG